MVLMSEIEFRYDVFLNEGFLRVLTVRVAICPGMTGTVLVLNKLSIFPIKYLRTDNVQNQTSIIYVDIFVFYQTFII